MTCTWRHFLDDMCPCSHAILIVHIMAVDDYSSTSIRAFGQISGRNLTRMVQYELELTLEYELWSYSETGRGTTFNFRYILRQLVQDNFSDSIKTRSAEKCFFKGQAPCQHRAT